MEQNIKDAPSATLQPCTQCNPKSVPSTPVEPTNREILQAMLVLLKAQVALIEMRLVGKTEQSF